MKLMKLTGLSYRQIRYSYEVDITDIYLNPLQFYSARPASCPGTGDEISRIHTQSGGEILVRESKEEVMRIFQEAVK